MILRDTWATTWPSFSASPRHRHRPSGRQCCRRVVPCGTDEQGSGLRHGPRQAAGTRCATYRDVPEGYELGVAAADWGPSVPNERNHTEAALGWMETLNLGRGGSMTTGKPS